MAWIAIMGDVSGATSGRLGQKHGTDCNTLSEYYDEWEPSAIAALDNARSVHIMKSEFDRLKPGINLNKVDPASLAGDIYVESKGVFKAPGGYKDFQAAKKSGEIVVKPYKVFKLNSVATPHFYSTRPTEKYPYVFQARDFMKTNNPVLSPCWVPHWNFTSFEGYNIYNDSLNTVFSLYHEPKSYPAHRSVVERFQRSVLLSLDTVPRNAGLVTKVVADANASTFDITTELGEMPETVKMIIDGIKGGIKLILRAKKDVAQQLSSGSIVRDSASLWMAYRYGLQPIVYSINDGLDLLDLKVRKFQSFRGRMDASGDALFQPPQGYELVSAPQIVHRTFLKYGYDLEAGKLQGLKMDLASTAWELIPLSFVFDWFFQVGDLISALSTPSYVNQVGCTYSVRCKGAVSLRDKVTQSTITTNIDYYKSEVINPQLNIGLNSDIFFSFKRSMDAIALSWLLFKKSK